MSHHQKIFSSLAAGTSGAKNILINDLASLATDQLITVVVKANVINCIIGDSSGNGRVVLWEQDVGKMEETKSYKLVSVKGKSFKGNNYLSLTSKSEIIPIDDIGDTAEIIKDNLKECRIVKKKVNDEIDLITYADQYESCVKCSSEVTSHNSALVVGVAQ